jgi:hypothetical protein
VASISHTSICSHPNLLVSQYRPGGEANLDLSDSQCDSNFWNDGLFFDPGFLVALNVSVSSAHPS